MAFTFTPTKIADVVEVTTDIHRDERGFFAELIKTSEFSKADLPAEFQQINHSHSTKDVLRGLHYQLQPASQGKLVCAMSGEVFDVAVDIRKDSPTYGQWVGVTLSAEKKNALWIPPGLAHGYYTLSETADVLYFCTSEYAPEYERGIIWNDKEIGVEWPSQEPILSEKDTQFPAFKDSEI